MIWKSWISRNVDILRLQPWYGCLRFCQSPVPVTHSSPNQMDKELTLFYPCHNNNKKKWKIKQIHGVPAKLFTLFILQFFGSNAPRILIFDIFQQLFLCSIFKILDNFEQPMERSNPRPFEIFSFSGPSTFGVLKLQNCGYSIECFLSRKVNKLEYSNLVLLKGDIDT